MAKEITGGCLCGGVRYKATRASENMVACHCGQCRKQTITYDGVTRLNTESNEDAPRLNNEKSIPV